MFQNKKLKRNATYAIAEVALLIALCPPLISTDIKKKKKIEPKLISR